MRNFNEITADIQAVDDKLSEIRKWFEDNEKLLKARRSELESELRAAMHEAKVDKVSVNGYTWGTGIRESIQIREADRLMSSIARLVAEGKSEYLAVFQKRVTKEAVLEMIPKEQYEEFGLATHETVEVYKRKGK